MSIYRLCIYWRFWNDLLIDAQDDSISFSSTKQYPESVSPPQVMKLRVNGDINDFPRVTVSKWGRGLYPGSSASHKCTRPIIPPEEIQENRQPSGPRWRKAGYPRVLLSPGDILLVKVKVDITSDVIFCYFPFIGYDDKDVCLL